VDDIVRQALVLISTKNDPCSSLVELLQQSDLEPEEVIVIFHQFFILDTLTYHSDSILTLLQDSYFEEFKLVAAFDFHMLNTCLKILSNWKCQEISCKE